MLLSCPRPCCISLPSLPPLPWQQNAVWVCVSGADSPLAWELELDPSASPLLRPGQVRLKVGVGDQEPPGISSGTCACGTAPPVGPGTEVSRSAAGRGAPASRWRWPSLRGLESAFGPGSLLELRRSEPESNRYTIYFNSNKLLERCDHVMALHSAFDETFQSFLAYIYCFNLQTFNCSRT